MMVDQSRVRRLAALAMLAMATVLTAVVTILVSGAYVPNIYYVTPLGTLILSIWPTPAFMLALLGFGLALPSRRRVGGKIVLGLAVVAMLGIANIFGQNLWLAKSRHIDLTVADILSLRRAPASGPDVAATYMRDQGEALGVLIYRPPGSAPPAGWPIMINIHGGGWVEGNNAQQSGDMRWYAQHGWLVASINYSLSTGERHLWDVVTGQIGCALVWSKTHLPAQGGDISRMILRGNSAGATLSLNAGYLSAAGRLPSRCGGVPPKVRAVVAVYPPVDLAAFHDQGLNYGRFDVRKMATRYIGGTPREFPDRYRMVSPSNQIVSNAPPTLIFISEKDSLVPPTSMEAFVEKARLAGVDVSPVRIPYGQHVFDLANVGNAMARQITLRFIDAQAEAPPVPGR